MGDPQSEGGRDRCRGLIMFMTHTHPKWTDFCTRLEGPAGCNFREEPNAKGELVTVWDCGGGTDKSKAIAILKDMGLTDYEIDASCVYYDALGGRCDCEILWTVRPVTLYP